MNFEWDFSKARANISKHGVSFTEAETVFYDDNALQFDDRDAEGEARYLMLGMSRSRRILVVVHTERKGAIRIISARRTRKKEEAFYRWQFRG